MKLWAVGCVFLGGGVWAFHVLNDVDNVFVRFASAWTLEKMQAIGSAGVSPVPQFRMKGFRILPDQIHFRSEQCHSLPHSSLTPFCTNFLRDLILLTTAELMPHKSNLHKQCQTPDTGCSTELKF